MGATAAHRAPERMADGTCTREWAWMTDKCRRRIYNNGDLTKKGDGQEGKGSPET